MEYITYGNKNLPILVFVHGSCTTAETCYSTIVKQLQKSYRCVVCKLDGHYDGAKDFVSLDEEAKQIENYIRNTCGGKIHALIGLSLGSTICIRLMERNNCVYEKVILDGVYVQNKGFLYACFCTWMCNAGIDYIRKGGKVPDKLVELIFGQGNKSVVEMMYGDISRESVKNVCHQVYQYKINQSLDCHGSKVTCIRGEFEPIPQRSFELLKVYLPDIQEIIIPKCGHAQFLNENPNEYVKTLLRLL